MSLWLPLPSLQLELRSADRRRQEALQTRCRTMTKAKRVRSLTQRRGGREKRWQHAAENRAVNKHTKKMSLGT